MKKLFAVSALALSMALGLAGCDKLATKPASFQNTDVTGLQYAQDFALTDHNGKARTLADFKGKVVVMFFGYTQCPDVCPTTMAEMATVMKELGPQAEQVQVLFVTVDPERDTQALLAQYVPAFDQRFLGHGDGGLHLRLLEREDDHAPVHAGFGTAGRATSARSPAELCTSC